MKKTSKIYIAGHTGSVGSAFYRKLKNQGYKKIITCSHKRLDLRNQQKTEAFFKKHKPEYVILAAAKVGGILANATFVGEFIYDNLMIATNVINAAYRYKAKKLLNLGSSCIYPKLAPQPLKEKYLLTDTLEPTNEPYAVAKIAAIKLCRYYNEQYGTDFISVMPTNIYGPNDNYNLQTTHALPALIRKFHLAKLLQEGNFTAIKKDIKKYKLGFGLDKKIKDNKSIVNVLKQLGITDIYVMLWGSGKPYREFMYVEDLVDACMFLMKKKRYSQIGEFVNIGTGKDLRISQLAETIKKIVGFKGKIKKDLKKADGTPRKRLDVSRINKLGWKAKTNLAQGIKKSYHWYLWENPVRPL